MRWLGGGAEADPIRPGQHGPAHSDGTHERYTGPAHETGAGCRTADARLEHRPYADLYAEVGAVFGQADHGVQVQPPSTSDLGAQA